MDNQFMQHIILREKTLYLHKKYSLMLKIPYGESDLKTIIDGDYFYQDRTQFIETLEKWSPNYLVFLRPRRFGKSLFVNTLHYYYGLEHKAIFTDIFGKLYIGNKPTRLANSFLVLKFEFSRIDTTTQDGTYKGFLRNTLASAQFFLKAYSNFFSEKEQLDILSQTSPEAVIQRIFTITKNNDIPHKIYVLVDEYDQFANELLSFDMERFKSNVSRNGFVRKFYESLKTATGEGIIGKIFITGVSPVTMDSVTSGFNISDNITLNRLFNDMMGFTHEEVAGLLHKADVPKETLPKMMSDLEDWYDGYRFAADTNTYLFNPDMVLYFLKEYSIDQKYPYQMLDVNIMSDYRKIRNIFKIGGEETARFELLEELVKDGYIDFSLTSIFNLEDNFTDDDFLSLLYYLGLLTFKEARTSNWRFKIPNYVIKKLYFEYFTSIFLAKTRFANTHRPIIRTIDALINDADLMPFLEIVEYVLAENHSNRDELTYGEKHLQTLMIGLFFPYKAFIIHSEYESRRQYPDIFLERVPSRIMNYEIVIELKYVKKSAEKTLPSVILDATAQLASYMTTERFSRPDVRGFYVVFL